MSSIAVEKVRLPVCMWCGGASEEAQKEAQDSTIPEWKKRYDFAVWKFKCDSEFHIVYCEKCRNAFVVKQAIDLNEKMERLIYHRMRENRKYAHKTEWWQAAAMLSGTIMFVYTLFLVLWYFAG